MKTTVLTTTLIVALLNGVSVFGQSVPTKLTHINQKTDLLSLQKQEHKRNQTQYNLIQSVRLQDSKYEGGVATGGGDLVSQEVRALINQLPSKLRSTGLHYFPEVNIETLEELTKKEILVEIKNDIRINDAPKNLKFDRDQYSIQVDAKLWSSLDNSPDTELKKMAIIFHEVLGLLGIEKNNDYTVSNRLLGVGYFSAIHLGTSKNQIYPKDFQDSQVIYWKESQNGLLTIFYCKDRSIISTCRPLGLRSYSRFEISNYLNQLNVEYAKAKNKAEFNSKISKIGLGIAVSGMVILSPVVAPTLGLTALIGGTTATSAGLLSFGSLMGWFSTSMTIESLKRDRLDSIGAAEQIMNGSSGTAVSLGRYTSFDEYARSLHKFLTQLEVSSKNSNLN